MAADGAPVFEIFLTTDKNGEYKHQVASDYGGLTASVADFQWTQNLKEPPSVQHCLLFETCHKNMGQCTELFFCSHAVNGVSRAHSELLKTRVFPDFYELWPEKFQYKTNGVTQRRWIVVSNPSLCALISKWLGTESWIRNADLLARLREYASNPNLQQELLLKFLQFHEEASLQCLLVSCLAKQISLVFR